MAGQVSVEASEILIVEHFAEQRILATGTTVDQWFGGAVRGTLSTGEFSRLDADGRLPQNKVGRLSGVMVTLLQYGLPADEDAGRLLMRLQRELLQSLICEIYIGNVLIAEHPAMCLAAPIGSGMVGTTTAAKAVHNVDNSGWPVAFGEHPIVERQSLALRAKTGAALGGTLAATSLKMGVTWQVKTATVQAGRI